MFYFCEKCHCNFDRGYFESVDFEIIQATFPCSRFIFLTAYTTSPLEYLIGSINLTLSFSPQTCSFHSLLFLRKWHVHTSNAQFWKLAHFWVLYFSNIPTCNMSADSVNRIQNQTAFGHLHFYHPFASQHCISLGSLVSRLTVLQLLFPLSHILFPSQDLNHSQTQPDDLFKPKVK